MPKETRNPNVEMTFQMFLKSAGGCLLQASNSDFELSLPFDRSHQGTPRAGTRRTEFPWK
jgi:hypothetical protein